jgi:hypothetical protein
MSLYGGAGRADAGIEQAEGRSAAVSAASGKPAGGWRYGSRRLAQTLSGLRAEGAGEKETPTRKV